MLDHSIHPKTCIIGAGCSGLAAARALLAADLDFDLFEADTSLGGNWSNGVYDNAYLISSRDTSGFTEYPMPKSYPDFPSRVQMRDYIQAYATHFGITKRVSFNESVISVRALGDGKRPAWEVETASGIKRTYDSVVVANGHLWNKVIPEYPGTFKGKQIHSRDYRNIKDIDGQRVLVVGAGNSGCDMVAEAAFAGFDVTLSMRRGHWFLPKTLFGVPRGELFIARQPRWLQKLLLKCLSYVVVGRIDKRGLPRPEKPLLAEPPIINSLLFYLLEHGRAKIASEIERFDGDAVIFRDGRREIFDTIIWTTGYKTSFPFLEDGHLDWAQGQPLRIGGGAIAPRAPGLYFNGLASPRGGNLPMHSACAELIGDCIKAQRVLGAGLLEQLKQSEKPSPLMDGNVAKIIEETVELRRHIYVLVENSSLSPVAALAHKAQAMRQA